MTKYIRVPFADSGDKADVPVASASDGSVSFVQGYPIAYSLDPETDTAAKRIERTKMNFLFNQITAAIQEIQQNGVAPYITAADNGGTAYSYALGALVMYNGAVYQSLTANNSQLPTVAANWSPVSNQTNSLPVISGFFTGDANVITSQGIYSVTAAATNGPLAQTAVLEVYQRSSGAVVQLWHSASATASVQNRHYVRTGVISGGVATWTPWTQTTLRPVELASGQDLNTLTESGVYQGGTFTNGPSGIGTAVGFVEVTATGAGAYIKQVLHLAVLNVRYQRTYASSAWTAWKQIATTNLTGRVRATSAGSFTAPEGVTTVYLSGCAGGGGGGGGGGSSASQIGGGGGGGGAGQSAVLLPVTVVPGQTYAFTIGSGGTAGTAGSSGSTPAGDGGAGSSTTFGSLLTLVGGSGGLGGVKGASPIGGGNAGAGYPYGSTGMDCAADAATGCGGTGASGPYGGGGGNGKSGKAATGGNGGYPGVGFGAGGGGGGGVYTLGLAAGGAGAAGAPGILLIEW